MIATVILYNFYLFRETDGKRLLQVGKLWNSLYRVFCGERDDVVVDIRADMFIFLNQSLHSNISMNAQ